MHSSAFSSSISSYEQQRHPTNVSSVYQVPSRLGFKASPGAQPFKLRIEMFFYYYFQAGLALKPRQKATRKWPIVFVVTPKIISVFRWEYTWKSVFFTFLDSKCIGVQRTQSAVPITKFVYVDNAQLEEKHDIQLAPTQLAFAGLEETCYKLQLLPGHPLQEVWF